MEKKIPAVVLVCIVAIMSCKKASQSELPKPTSDTATSNIFNTIVPKGFTWENSRNINFTLNVTDTRFQNSIFIMAIYDGDPAVNGNLLSKGSASTLSAFITKLYISKQITEVYVIKYALDGSKVTRVVPVGDADIVESIGIN